MSSVPPPGVEKSSMRALSWVSLGGGAGAEVDSDDPAPVLPGALMRFGSPPRAWDFPSANQESSSSDFEAFSTSKRRRRRRPAPPKQAVQSSSSSSDEGLSAAALLSKRGAPGGGGDGHDAVGSVENDTSAVMVKRGLPTLAVNMEDKTRGKDLNKNEGSGTRASKRARIALFKKLE